MWVWGLSCPHDTFLDIDQIRHELGYTLVKNGNSYVYWDSLYMCTNKRIYEIWFCKYNIMKLTVSSLCFLDTFFFIWFVFWDTLKFSTKALKWRYWLIDWLMTCKFIVKSLRPKNQWYCTKISKVLKNVVFTLWELERKNNLSVSFSTFVILLCSCPTLEKCVLQLEY